MNTNLATREHDQRPIAEKTPPRPQLPSAVLRPYLDVKLLCRGSMRKMFEFSSAVVRFEDERRYANLDRSESLKGMLDAAEALPSGEDLRAMNDTLSTALESVATQAEISSITAAMCDAIPTFDPMRVPGYLDALLFVLETENAVEPFCPHALAGAAYKLLRSERYAPNPDAMLDAIREEQERYNAWRQRVDATLAELANLPKFREELAEQRLVNA